MVVVVAVLVLLVVVEVCCCFLLCGCLANPFRGLYCSATRRTRIPGKKKNRENVSADDCCRVVQWYASTRYSILRRNYSFHCVRKNPRKQRCRERRRLSPALCCCRSHHLLPLVVRGRKREERPLSKEKPPTFHDAGHSRHHRCGCFLPHNTGGRHHRIVLRFFSFCAAMMMMETMSTVLRYLEWYRYLLVLRTPTRSTLLLLLLQYSE